jgi:CBS domain-containing protein
MAFNVRHLIPESQTPEALVVTTEEMSIQDALDRMIEHDFSQLPVVDKEFKLKGLITSDSILRTVSYFKTTLDKIKVSHATLSAKACRQEDDLSELLNGLKDASAIPIVDKVGKLIAIVTNYDTAEYYRQRAEDIMLAEDIETTLKDFIESAHKDNEGNINNDTLQKAIEDITSSGNDLKKKFKQALCSYLNSAQLPPQPDTQLIEKVFTRHLLQRAEVKAFEDLTLFEYTQLFKNLWDDKYKDAFKALEWKAIQNLLDEVRATRNAIAHFREVSSNQRKHLKFCADLFERHRPLSEEAPLLNEPVIPIIGGERFVYDSPEEILQPTERVEAEFTPISRNINLNESRYAPLASWLDLEAREGHEKIPLTFEQIERIIDDKLPPSARQHRNWWANDSVSHTQSQQWLDVGWRVSSINLSEERVVFSLMSDRQSAYISFFNDLRSKLQSIDDLTVKLAMNPQGRSWLTVEVSSAELPEITWIAFSFARKSRFRIESYIDTGDQSQNKQVFDTLYNYKTDIESKLGEPLSWERLDSRRASRIALYQEKASIMNTPEDLAKLQDWSAEMMVRFYWAIAPHLHNSLGNA